MKKKGNCEGKKENIGMLASDDSKEGEKGRECNFTSKESPCLRERREGEKEGKRGRRNNLPRVKKRKKLDEYIGGKKEGSGGKKAPFWGDSQNFSKELSGFPIPQPPDQTLKRS